MLMGTLGESDSEVIKRTCGIDSFRWILMKLGTGELLRGPSHSDVDNL